MFNAIARSNAFRIAPSGIDSLIDERGQEGEGFGALVQSFAATRALLTLLPTYQGTGRHHAIVQKEDIQTQYIELDG